MNDLEIETDEGGICTIALTEEILNNIPALMSKCEANKIGASVGVFKGRVPQENRTTSVEELVAKVSKSLTSTKFMPQVQSFVHCSSSKNVFSFKKKSGVPDNVIAEFMRVAKNAGTFCNDQVTCCTQAMKEGGINQLLGHYWEEIRKASCPSIDLAADPNDNAISEMIRVGEILKSTYENKIGHSSVGKELSQSSSKSKRKRNFSPFKSSQQGNLHPWNKVRNMEKGKSIHVVHDTSWNVNDDSMQSGIVYGARLELPHDTHTKITKNFSLSKLGTILDLHPDKYPGISWPFLYIGTTHSSAAFHTEDGALWSSHFLHFGAVKIWIVVPPEYVNYLIDVLRTTNLPKAHTSCQNVLGHKVVMVDTDFLEEHNIPHSVIMQHPGELVILWPNAAHLVFNTGWNCAEAVNFATIPWIIDGVYATQCDCFGEDQVQLDMVPFVAAFRPDLLHTYLAGHIYDCGPKPPSQLRFSTLRKFEVSIEDTHASDPENNSDPNDSAYDQQGRSVFQSKSLRRNTIFQCIACPQLYKGKLLRLLEHCQKEHPSNHNLQELTKKQYALPDLQTLKMNLCPHCGTFIRGTPSNLNKHIARQHMNKNVNKTEDV